MQNNPFSNPVEFTLIVSCYNEERTIEEFHRRVVEAFDRTGRSYEIIFTNDGSKDRTFQKLQEIQEKDPHTRTIIDFFRNFGQLAGMSVGVSEARGRHLIFMDSDLQLDPEDFPKLLAKFDQGYDVVSGKRVGRRDPWQRILFSKIANFIIRRLANSRLTDFGCTYKIFDGNLVRKFPVGERRLFNPAETISCADRVAEVDVAHHPRRVGKSGWTMGKLINFMIDHVIYGTKQPFQSVSIATAFVGVIIFLLMCVEFCFGLQTVGEISHSLRLNLFCGLSFVMIALLCLIGEFQIRNFKYTQGRPCYIVRTKIVQSREVMPNRLAGVRNEVPLYRPKPSPA